MEKLREQYQANAKRYQRNQNECSNQYFWNKNDRSEDRLITPESSISSLDGLTDLSFYELPSSVYQENLRVDSKLHLSELIASPQRVSRPPHHATAEARHIYTIIDSDRFHSSSWPLTQTVPNNTTHTQPSTQTTYHQTVLPRSGPVASVQQHGDKRVAFSHMKMPNGTTSNLDGSDSVYIATVEKPVFRASARENNSNRNGSIQKPCSLQNNGKIRSETLQTHARSGPLVSGHSHSGNYTGSLTNRTVQQGVLEAPNQRSFSLSSNGILSSRSQKNGIVSQSMKEKRPRHETVEKEHIKSVSFRDLGDQSIPKVTKLRTNNGLDTVEDLVRPNRQTIQRHKQSNLSQSGKRLEELLLASRSALASEQPMRHLNGSLSEPVLCKNFHMADSSSRKPLSPPTRDTDGLCNPKSSTTDHNGAVQVLSLYEGQAIFQEHLPKTELSRSRVWQSNTKVDLQHVEFKPDNESGLKLSKRKTWAPLSKPKSVSDDVCIFKRGKTSFGKSRGKEHSLDDEIEPNTWSHLSLANSFSVDTSQRISSALWAMKLMEAAHFSSPGVYQNLLLKARLFRRWLQRTRLKRVMKQEEQRKDENATAYWQMELLQKYFNAWKKSGQTMAVSADMLYKKQMLRKGFKGLKFAVEQQRMLCSDLQSRIKGGFLARYWLKWQKALKKKETQRLKIAFGRWKSSRLEQSREKILEDMADRHIMSRNYTRWKLKYQVEQKNSVASLHFKICLLTKSWHCWRVYVAEMIVKKRLKDVARLKYDEHLTASAFTVWRDNTRKSVMAGNVAGRRLAVRAFYRWKNWAQYAKIIRLRFQSMCKEYYYKSLVKAAFNKWKHRLQNNRADTFRRQTQQKRILKLWYLRYRRKVIHRHLCKALAKKSKKRRFFGKWRNFTKVQQNKRERFVEKVQLLEVKHLFIRWKEHSSMKSSLRSKLAHHFRRKDQQLTRKAMDKWRFAMRIVNLREQVRLSWSRRCVRKACKSWKLLLRKKRLEQRLIDVTPTLKMIIMRRTFQKWIVQKRIVDDEKEKVAHVKSILEQTFKLRVLLAWRVANQESQIIAPMVARRERKVIARVFDAWRLRVSRQNHVVDHLSRARKTLLAKFFCRWRDRATLIQKERNAIGNLCNSKLLRHFKAWRGFVLDRRLDRLRTRAKALSLMQSYFSIWKSKVEEKHEAKDKQYASQARQRLLVSWVFNYWCQTARKLRDFLNEQEERCISQNKTNLLARVFRRWLKLSRNEQKTREHIEYRRNKLLRKIIHAWRKDTKETLEKEVFNFTTSLTLDSSIGSCLGSTYRSTLGSSYHSDALSTSGYLTDVRMRRGSGPVPVQYLKIDDRDDEVISLPGRFDQLRSPTIKTAPITVLREASSGQMSPQTIQPETIMFPQVIQSPSPSSSPENMTPGFSCTVPVKYEEDVVPALGLHSCSDESEEQDEQGSMMSSYSMTGRSIESIRDREMVLTDTILHWRRLPLSLTFRTWMKFARKRKLLRELLFYLREKKRKEVMAWTLKKWRRELFVKFTAREHWLYKTRHKCLMAWHRYAKHNQVKEERHCMADKHRRTVCLRRFLTMWRDRYNSKLLLQKFAIHWRKEALVSKQHKDITEAIKHGQNSRLLKENFLYWLEQTKKSQRAKTFYFENLVPKFFAAWYVFIREVVTRKKKLKMFCERRLLAMSFREWRSRFIASQRAVDLLEGKETSLLLEIVKKWHSWAEGLSSRRSKAQHFRRCTELRTMKEIFAMWRDVSQQLRNFTKTYELKLMRRVLYAWQGLAVLEIQNRRKLLEFKEEKARNMVRQSFKFWRGLQMHTEHARSNLQKAERRLVKQCFDEWRHDALKQRADKHNVHRLQRKMFLSWYDQHIKRKTARRLISNWRSKTEEAKFMNGKALEVVQEREKKVLRQSFDTWVLEAHKIQKAKNLAWINCMQRAFVGWYTYAHSRVLHRQILTEVEEKKRQSLLFSSFARWNQLFRRRERNLEVLENFLEQKQMQLLKVYMTRWRKDTLNCRAQKFHERRLAEKYFTEWWFRFSTMKGLETVKEKILSRKARAAAHHWRRWTVRVKKHAKQAEDLRSKLEERLLHHYFCHWVHTLQLIQRAEVHHGQAIVKRSLRRWRYAAQKRLEERRKMKEFQERLNTKRMTKIFSSWCDALKTVTRQKLLVKTQLAKHNLRMLKHAMVQWRRFVKKATAEKHHNIICVAKCFLEWKLKTEDKLQEKKQEQQQQEKAEQFYHLKLRQLCFRGWLFDIRADKYERLRLNRLVERAFSTWKKKCSLSVTAKELIDRRMYDKYWSQWRRQLIRKRVSELMQKHEEKKLLSEVFVAWFRLVLVRRQLLRVYKTHVTKKWFIKWMQKYNDS